MAWSIEGSDSLGLGITADGNRDIWGTGRTSYFGWLFDDPKNANSNFDDELKTTDVHWRLLCSDASKLDIDGAGYGLWERVQSNKKSANAMAHTWQSSSDIGITAVLPPASFAHVWDLFKLKISNASLLYNISLDFAGFPQETLDPDLATFEEFRNGKPYFSRGVDVSLRPCLTTVD